MQPNPSFSWSTSLNDSIAKLKIVTIHSWILLDHFGKFRSFYLLIRFLTLSVRFMERFPLRRNVYHRAWAPEYGHKQQTVFCHVAIFESLIGENRSVLPCFNYYKSEQFILKLVCQKQFCRIQLCNYPEACARNNFGALSTIRSMHRCTPEVQISL